MVRSLCAFLLLAGGSSAFGQSFVVDGGISGSWFNASRSGEGWVVQVLSPSQAFVVWFTYPPTGAAGEQQWMAGTGVVSGNQIVVEDADVLSGPAFGDAFDVDDVVRADWGDLTFTFSDCATGELSYVGPSEYGSGTVAIERLSQVRGSDCGTQVTEFDIAGGEKPLVSTGAWFQTDRSGEGFLIEALEDGRGLAFWFTFTPEGEAAWLIGTGEFTDTSLQISDADIVTGTRFGDAFDPDAVLRQDWGELDFFFDDCNRGRVAYRSALPEYGSGAIELERLTSLDTLSCRPYPEAALAGGAWTEVVSPPTARSELAAVSLEGRAYVIGGFGGASTLEVYDPATDTWDTLPPLPEALNHLMAASYGREIFVFGGYADDNLRITSDRAYAYDIDAQTWRTLAELPVGKAAGTAVSLGDKIYVVGGEPNDSLRYHPPTDTYETLPSPSRATDHSNAVAFDGEIWLLGGRPAGGETNAVAIYNPAANSWRAGPPMIDIRSGFGATVLQGQIAVFGGEVIGTSGPRENVQGFEVYHPASGTWQQGPELPLALHGVGAAAIDGVLYALGGSTAPGGINNPGRTFRYAPGESP